LTGAKTVNGPAPASVSTNPAALTAATSVVWSFELTAFSTMFFVLYIGAPPTIGLSLPLICAAADEIPINANIAAVVSRKITFISSSKVLIKASCFGK